MYPQRQPDLNEIELPLLANLAEAVEKYQVYSAMDIAKIFMGFVFLKTYSHSDS